MNDKIFEIINEELIEKLNDNDNDTFSGSDHVSQKMGRAIQLYDMVIIGKGDILDIATKLRNKMGVSDYVNYMFLFEDRGYEPLPLNLDIPIQRCKIVENK